MGIFEVSWCDVMNAMSFQSASVPQIYLKNKKLELAVSVIWNIDSFLGILVAMVFVLGVKL